jgi:hypothetical protein
MVSECIVVNKSITISLTLGDVNPLHDVILGRKFESDSEEVVVGCRKLQNEGPHALYSSFNLIKFIKSSKRRIWVLSKHGRD